MTAYRHSKLTGTEVRFVTVIQYVKDSGDDRATRTVQVSWGVFAPIVVGTTDHDTS